MRTPVTFYSRSDEVDMLTRTGIFTVNNPVVAVNHVPCGAVARTQCGWYRPCSLEYKTEPSSRFYQLMCGLTADSPSTCFVLLPPNSKYGLRLQNTAFPTLLIRHLVSTRIEIASG